MGTPGRTVSKRTACLRLEDRVREWWRIKRQVLRKPLRDFISREANLHLRKISRAIGTDRQKAN